MQAPATDVDICLMRDQVQPLRKTGSWTLMTGSREDVALFFFC